MFIPKLGRGARGPGNVRLIYLLAALTTISQGAFEFAYPLDLHRQGISLDVIGGAVAATALGQLASRIPGGAWYRPATARRLNAGGQVLLGLSALGVAATGLFLVEAPLAAIHGAAFGLVTTWQLAMLIEARPQTRLAGPMLAWYTAAISLGYSVGYPTAAYAIAWFGHSWALALSGLIALGAAAVTLALRPLPARPEPAPTPADAAAGTWPDRALAALKLPGAIWLATLLVLYINFMSDSVSTFFPIYGLAIGLSLGFVGLLRSINSLAATGVRFAAAAVLRITPPAGLNHAAVVAMAVSALLLSAFRQPWILALAFLGLGLSRGLIRVTSATAVAEQRERLGPRIGLASGVYNAGLDVGSMLAPPVAGALATGFSIPIAFRSVAIALPLLYYGVWLLIRPRSTPRPAPAAPADPARP